jgi:hypothetical protein
VAFGRYIEGLLLITLAFVPLCAASHAWRARLIPDWTGAAARLAEIILAVATVICVSEILGAIDLFRVAVMVPVLTLVGMTSWYVGHRSSERLLETENSRSVYQTDTKPVPPGAILAAIVSVSVVAADWSTRTVDALHHGMTTPDTLWYHMPFAARFVQQGTITPLHYTQPDVSTVFYPASSELIHALGIMFMGNDLLSPLINLGWGAVALLAAWCIGRPFGVAPVSLTGVAIAMTTPGMVATQPGSAYDDTVGLALLLSCAALLVTAMSFGDQGRFAAQGVAALAAGLALGTKLNFIAPVFALTVGILVLALLRRRLREGAVWLLLIALTGSFWYLRNLIAVGNPLPLLHIKVGSLALPSPVLTTPTTTVVHFILNGSSWRQDFLPGLRLFFGPPWWAILALSGTGLVLGVIAGPGRVPRIFAWVGLFTAAAFAITPQPLAALGAPVFFVDQVRLAEPAVVIGLMILPLSPILRRKNRSYWLLGIYGAILAATQIDSTIWPGSLFAQRFSPAIHGVDSLVGLLCGVVVLAIGLLLFHLRRRRRQWRPTVIALVAISAAVLISGFGIQQFYLQRRYTTSSSSGQLPSALSVFFTWAQHVHDARIAVAGPYTQLQYGLYGRDDSNYVQYLGQEESNGGYAPITNCDRWRQALNAGHYDYVLTSTVVTHRKKALTTPSSFTLWTGTDPASTLIRREIVVQSNFSGNKVSNEYIGFSLFRLHRTLEHATCIPGFLSTGSTKCDSFPNNDTKFCK